MGKSKYMNQILELFEKSPIVEFSSIERVVGTEKRKKNNYAKLLVSNLIKKGTIKKVAKGKYTKYDDTGLAVLCFRPAYNGLQSALSFYGIWEQETIPIIITSKKVRTGIRKIMDGNILIRKIDSKFMFGFDYAKDGNFYLPYSDIEKTFIDMTVFKEKMSEEVLQRFREKIDKNKLKQYLKSYSKRMQKKAIDEYTKR